MYQSVSYTVYLILSTTLRENLDISFVNIKSKELKDYFDNILKDIDPNIKLAEEQRRAVVTDDDYCLLVAGAGAGKTTTMAAKVKYLVEKNHVNPEEIIVISYTNKAIGELKERINKSLKIPAKICTFHAFAFEIVKRFSVEPPEINFSSYQIVFDMLEKSIFNNKQLMRNLVLFLGYYFLNPRQSRCRLLVIRQLLILLLLRKSMDDNVLRLRLCLCEA